MTHLKKNDLYFSILYLLITCFLFVFFNGTQVYAYTSGEACGGRAEKDYAPGTSPSSQNASGTFCDDGWSRENYNPGKYTIRYQLDLPSPHPYFSGDTIWPQGWHWICKNDRTSKTQDCYASECGSRDAVGVCTSNCGREGAGCGDCFVGSVRGTNFASGETQVADLTSLDTDAERCYTNNGGIVSGGVLEGYWDDLGLGRDLYYHWDCKGPLHTPASGNYRHSTGFGAYKKLNAAAGVKPPQQGGTADKTNTTNTACYPANLTEPSTAGHPQAVPKLPQITATNEDTDYWYWTCSGVHGGSPAYGKIAKPKKPTCVTPTTPGLACNTCTNGSPSNYNSTAGTWICNPDDKLCPTVPGSCSVPPPACTWNTYCLGTYNTCYNGGAINGNGSTAWTCQPYDTLCPNKSCTVPLAQDPTCDITPKNKVIEPGESVTLSWTSTNATSVSAVSPTNWTTKTTPSGSQSVSPGGTTTYTLRVSGNNKTSTCSASVLINPPDNRAPDVTLEFPGDGSTVTPDETASPSFALRARGTDPDNDQVAVNIQYYPTEACGASRNPDCIVESGWSSYAVNASQTYSPLNKPLIPGIYTWNATATDGKAPSPRKFGTFTVSDNVIPTSPVPSCTASPDSGVAPLSVKATAGLNLGNPPLTGQVSYAYDFNYTKLGMKQSAVNDKTTAFNTYTTDGTYLVYCQIIVNGQAVKADGTLTSLLSDPSAWIRGNEIKVSPTRGGSGGEVAP